MEKSRRQTCSKILIYVGVIAISLISLFVCFSLINTINKRMKESATSNLLNASYIIRDTLEEIIHDDLNILNIIGNFKSNDNPLDQEKIDELRKAMKFDWIAVVDKNGDGTDSFANKFKAEELYCYDQWVPETTGYSNAYIGQSGRSQIDLWVPIFKDNVYIGTVFGSVILSKYYSANVFTFFNGDGRTYLFDGDDGKWILKSLGTDGTILRSSDIYSLLEVSNNKKEIVDEFREAIKAKKSGTVEFDFNDQPTYLCFLPLHSSKNWYIATAVPRDIILKEATEVQFSIRLSLTIVAFALLITGVSIIGWWNRKTKQNEIIYRNLLFGNISVNLNSVFIIYDTKAKKIVFVSDNVTRLFSLNTTDIHNDINKLFDMCNIPSDDPKRIDFIEGKLEENIIYEFNLANELGDYSRTIKTHLIPADLGQEIIVFTDITKDKEAEIVLLSALKQAKSAINAKSEFFSAISHDLKTPINGIGGMTSIALINLDDKERVRDCLSKINDSTTILLELVNDILDTEQIEQEKYNLDVVPINITELFNSIFNVYYPEMEQRNHLVDIQINKVQHEDVFGDPLCIRRIASNLISNAIKYTPQDGLIKLSLSEKPQMIEGYGCYEMIVQDNGYGMTEEFQTKLFQPFEREDNVKKRGIQGSGLGMLIVKNLVELMMGKVEVESTKDIGTTVKVIINLKINEDKIESNTEIDGKSVIVVSETNDTYKNIFDAFYNSKVIIEKARYKDAVDKICKKENTDNEYFAIVIEGDLSKTKVLNLVKAINKKLTNKIPILAINSVSTELTEEAMEELGISGILPKSTYKDLIVRRLSSIANENIRISKNSIPHGLRVLLAEDSPINRKIAIVFLENLGIKVDSVCNGREAVDAFSSSKVGTYDLIFMDIRMPQLNGYEATKIIRSLNRSDSLTIPIIAMTADAYKADEQAVKEAGMNEYCAKPISIDKIKSVIIKVINQKKGG